MNNQPNKQLQVNGGCLCGAVRYRIEGELVDAGYCHCRLCQCSSGAPVLAWLTVQQEALTIVQGKPKAYKSSAHYQRKFCSQCGTQLIFRKTTRPRTVDITIASLDKPAAVVPEYHIWTDSRIPWFDTNDTLCRYADAGPDVD
ncbi:hypothetical protein BTA51_23545 [Hahella sp. CCB-MM4]|uniref:GFA family protein n=1 Tax=Hahella sp. (strain CCB-MM4) TaxID=1926491 RepID=UPI000B9A77E4|nr:GFA family protein [Hahella sp. CCB-MM4]OZG70819.1 hypothetical protein BTA51_23545 [Hahella sp. CCB-MM4]